MPVPKKHTLKDRVRLAQEAGQTRLAQIARLKSAKKEARKMCAAAKKQFSAVKQTVLSELEAEYPKNMRDLNMVPQMEKLADHIVENMESFYFHPERRYVDPEGTFYQTQYPFCLFKDRAFRPFMFQKVMQFIGSSKNHPAVELDQQTSETLLLAFYKRFMNKLKPVVM